MTSYQKLKLKIKELEDRNRKLFHEFAKYIEDPNFSESLQSSMRVSSEYQMQKILLHGQRKGYTMMGLLEQISKNDPNEISTYNWDRSRDNDEMPPL